MKLSCKLFLNPSFAYVPFCRFAIAGEDLQKAVSSYKVFDFETEFGISKELVSCTLAVDSFLGACTIYECNNVDKTFLSHCFNLCITANSV